MGLIFHESLIPFFQQTFHFHQFDIGDFMGMLQLIQLFTEQPIPMSDFIDLTFFPGLNHGIQTSIKLVSGRV